MCKSENHIAILCLGSNTPDRAIQIHECLVKLNELCPKACCCSSCYKMAAEGVTSPQPPYLNCVCYIETSLSYNELNERLKQIEQQAGRTPADKAKGRVPLDVDIVVWDSEVVRPSDWKSGYFQRGLAELTT